MVRFAVIMLSVGVFFFSTGFARQVRLGEWKSYTDMKEVRAVALSGSAVVAATGGGMFRYNSSAGTYTRSTNAENLSTNDLTALMIDGANRIWVGASSGAVDVLDPTTGLWTAIPDIANSIRPQRAIRGFLAK
ncbi:MAG TPA: hypothetical protein VMM37_01890, partial [Bacteroidota bacterium]|nr:hypothetical protein [Bacteroidota bacterium]